MLFSKLHGPLRVWINLILCLSLLLGVKGFLSQYNEKRIESIQKVRNVEETTKGREICVPLFASTFKPPDFSIVEDDEDAGDGGVDNSYQVLESPTQVVQGDRESSPSHGKADVSAISPPRADRDAYTEESDSKISAGSNRRRPIIRSRKKMAGTSWMEKNKQFSKQAGVEMTPVQDQEFRESSSPSKPPPRRAVAATAVGNRGGTRTERTVRDNQSFRQDFRGTRCFVQGIPEGTSWQDLKDHFRVAGQVVFASVSVDPRTGQSKGHGIVQFETTEMAQNAIEIMRDHPLFGTHKLFVREDVQENQNGAQLTSRSTQNRGPTPPSKWQCANEDNAEYLSEEDTTSIKTLIKARDDARRRKKYNVSDKIRDELKEKYGVFLDDRLKMWWTSVDGSKVPQTIQDIKGDGKWKLKLRPWRQIPTTPENDACVNPDLVDALLTQRDVARREQDFSTADSLLREARDSPDGDLALRIHDESRTWRVWTEAPPPPSIHQQRRRDESNDRWEGETYNDDDEDEDDSEYELSIFKDKDPIEMRKRAAQQCMDIVKEISPEKAQEVRTLLNKFPGREFAILKKLKQQYRNIEP